MRDLFPGAAPCAISALLVGSVLLACGAPDGGQTRVDQEALRRHRCGLVISTALALDAQTVTFGDTLGASVTYTNTCTTALSVQSIVVAGRPPGGTNAGGPYDDFAPVQGPTNVDAGASMTLTASRTFASTDPTGSWYAYATWEDAAGAWHDGPSTSFAVDAPAIDAGAPEATPPSPPPAPTHFSTLPIGAALPTEAQCTAWVLASPTTDGMTCNATANATTPTSTWLSAFHANPMANCPGPAECGDYQNVTGNFTGSTDMILRWAACKWGIDEDVMRAEAVEESSWMQSNLGDNDTTCHSLDVLSGAPNYWSESSPCKPSKGLLQEKMLYWNGWPYSLSSTAFNADFRAAAQRSCMNGDIAWLVGTGAGNAYGNYPPADTDTALYGCMGHWFSGSWGDAGFLDYITTLQSLLAKKAWIGLSC